MYKSRQYKTIFTFNYILINIMFGVGWILSFFCNQMVNFYLLLSIDIVVNISSIIVFYNLKIFKRIIICNKYIIVEKNKIIWEDIKLIKIEFAKGNFSLNPILSLVFPINFKVSILDHDNFICLKKGINLIKKNAHCKIEFSEDCREANNW